VMRRQVTRPKIPKRRHKLWELYNLGAVEVWELEKSRSLGILGGVNCIPQDSEKKPLTTPLIKKGRRAKKRKRETGGEKKIKCKRPFARARLQMKIEMGLTVLSGQKGRKYRFK